MNSRGFCSVLSIFVIAGGVVYAATLPSPGPSATPTPQIDPKLFSGMQWRQVGPFRGGRALAIVGVWGEFNTWYFGAVAGGGWYTLDGWGNWARRFGHTGHGYS